MMTEESSAVDLGRLPIYTQENLNDFILDRFRSALVREFIERTQILLTNINIKQF